jgi:hypothetical protein
VRAGAIGSGFRKAGLVGAEGEDYVDGGFDFDGLAVEGPGVVAGLADGFDGGADEQGRAAEDAEAFNAAFGGDGGGYYDGSLGAGGEGDGWVVGLDGDDELSGGYS